MIVALTIGEQRAIPEAQWRVFNRTGIAHLISISGLHVTVFATLAGGARLRSRGASRRADLARSGAQGRGDSSASSAATLYVLLAGAQVPAVRTLLMLAVAAAGLVLARPGTAAVDLAVGARRRPRLGSVGGIHAGILAVVRRRRRAALRGSGTACESPLPSFAQRARSREHCAPARAPRPSSRSALVPGTLALFQQVSLVSPLANALAIPVVTFAVVPLALVRDRRADRCRLAGRARVFAALMLPLDALAAAPPAAWQQHAPPGWTVAVALAGVALLVAPRGVPGRVLGVLALLPLFVVRPTAPDPGTFRDDGARRRARDSPSSCETHRHALLYDTGPRYTTRPMPAGGSSRRFCARWASGA